MATAQEVWGFSTTLMVNMSVNHFMRSVNGAAVDRGINPRVPSDALDLSRDLILDEAAAEHNMQWEIVGTELRVWPVQIAWRSSWEFTESGKE